MGLRIVPGVLKTRVGYDVERKRRISMRKKLIVSITLIVLALCGYVYASLYAEYAPCNSTVGKVLKVVNDEIFTIFLEFI